MYIIFRDFFHGYIFDKRLYCMQDIKIKFAYLFELENSRVYYILFSLHSSF